MATQQPSQLRTHSRSERYKQANLPLEVTSNELGWASGLTSPYECIVVACDGGDYLPSRTAAY
eukprot:9444-Eustigmatos_ZCMA.PRE.1